MPSTNHDLTFTESIETIRLSRFSHALIENETFIMFSQYEYTANLLCECIDMLDSARWGPFYFLHPIYKAARRKIKKFNRKAKKFIQSHT